MSASLIWRLVQPRVFASLAVTTGAAAAQAAAGGQPVALWQNQQLVLRYPDGRRTVLPLASGESDEP